MCLYTSPPAADKTVSEIIEKSPGKPGDSQFGITFVLSFVYR